jgi:hypothetical protein
MCHDVIFPSTPGFPSCLFPLPFHFSSLQCATTCPAHLILDFIIVTIALHMASNIRTVTIYTNNSMQLSPSREAATCSAAQELQNILWNPEGSLTCSQKPTGTYPEPDHPIISKIHFNIIHLPTTCSS